MTLYQFRQKMKKFRIISLVLVLVIAVGLFVGCGKDEEQGGTEITWLTSMDDSPGNERVLKLFNEKLKEITGCTVKFVNIDGTQYDLRLASGEEFDLIYAPDHKGYWSNVRKGAFMEITEEDFKKYAPYIWENGKAQLDMTRYDGKYYGIPAIGDSWSADRCFAVRGDLMDKYGIENLDTIEDIDRFFMAAAEGYRKGEHNIIPYNIQGKYGYMIFFMFAADWGWGNPGSLSFGSHFYYDMFDPEYKLFMGIDTEKVRDYSYTVKKWYDAGVFSKSVLSATTTGEENFRNGKSAFAFMSSPATCNVLYNDVKEIEGADKWDVRFYAAYSNYQRAFNYASYGTAIGRNSKNKANALKVINAVLEHEELYNLLQYGEKGVHYDITGEGYKPLKVSEEQTYSPPYVSIKNTAWDFKTKYDYPYAEDLAKELKGKVLDDPIVNCPVNTTDDKEVQAMSIRINDVYAEVSMARLYGAVDNVDAAIAKEKKALKDAGADQYIKYLQKTVDEFVKNQPDAMKQFEENKRQVLEYNKANPNKTHPNDYK